MIVPFRKLDSCNEPRANACWYNMSRYYGYGARHLVRSGREARHCRGLDIDAHDYGM